MKGNPLTLVGHEVKVGQAAPDFTVLDQDLAEVKLSRFQGKTCIISAVPSLDTSVCDVQTRRFNEEAARWGDEVVVLTISMDLPFAQSRWCGAAGIENLQLLSDYRDGCFGESFGVLIKELRLLARAVFIVDQSGKIGYIQLVKELTNEPDYADVEQALGKLA